MQCLLASLLFSLCATAQSQVLGTASEAVSDVVDQALGNSACAPGLKMFIARGTDELPGTGVTGAVGLKVAGRIKGSAIEAVDYPATQENPAYEVSVADGSATLRSLVLGYSLRCPGSKMAVLGYSQGAQITADVLCGSSFFWGGREPLPEDATKNVVGIVMFGDPSLAQNASFRRGTAMGHGIFSRPDISVCEKLSKRIVSYCDTGDIYCDQASKPDVVTHLVYVPVRGDDAAEFLVRQYGLAGNSTR